MNEKKYKEKTAARARARQSVHKPKYKIFPNKKPFSMYLKIL